MKKILLAVLASLVIMLEAKSQETDEKFNDEKGRFRASFPIKPKVSDESSNTDFGTLTIYSFTAKLENDDNLSYSIHYIDLPKKMTDTLGVENTYALFNGFQESNINSDNIQLVGSFNHELKGYIGREFRWQYNEDGIFSRMRFYLIDNRLYIITVNTAAQNNFNIGINIFFDSFELIDTPENPRAIETPKKRKQVYSIDFPNTAEAREMAVPTKYGSAKVTAEMYQPKLKNDDNLAYMAMVLEYPIDITVEDGFDLDTYFSEVVQNSISGRQSTLISKKRISKDGVEGIEVEESFKGGLIIIRQQTFLKNDLQVSIQVMTIPANDDNISMNDFFESFMFIDPNLK